MNAGESVATGSMTKALKRYRMPGIEREGIAQLSLLETALWPLQGGKLPSNRFDTEYSYSTPTGRKRYGRSFQFLDHTGSDNASHFRSRVDQAACILFAGADGQVVVGENASIAIHNACQQLDADFIAIATHGRGGRA